MVKYALFFPYLVGLSFVTMSSTQKPTNQIPRCKQRGIKLATLQSSGVFDPRGIRQLAVQARPLDSLLAGIKQQQSSGFIISCGLPVHFIMSAVAVLKLPPGDVYSVAHPFVSPCLVLSAAYTLCRIQHSTHIPVLPPLKPLSALCLLLNPAHILSEISYTLLAL